MEHKKADVCESEGDFDATFSTLSLVNSPDMDAFIKAVLIMDDKPAQNLRGELNHAIAKHLDTDEKFRKKFIDNKYEDFNLGYIKEIYKKLINAKTDLYKGKIKESLIAILESCESLTKFNGVMRDYAIGAQDLSYNNLTPGVAIIDFMNKCCPKDNKTYIKHLINVHKYIYKIYELHDQGREDAIVDKCFVTPIYTNSRYMSCLVIDFCTEYYDKNVRIDINISELNEETGRKTLEHPCTDLVLTFSDYLYYLGDGIR